MRTAHTFGRLFALILVVAATGPSGLAMVDKDPPGLQKLDKALREKAKKPHGRTRVIVRGRPGLSSEELGEIIGRNGGGNRRALRLIGGRAAELPDVALAALANDPKIAQVSEDRPIAGAMERTTATVGATTVRRDL